jgi:hypothetical protein
MREKRRGLLALTAIRDGQAYDAEPLAGTVMTEDPTAQYAIFRDPLPEHVHAGKCVVASGELFLADLVIFGMLQRSLDLVLGVKTLIADRNLTCAVPLLRLQLDSLIRLAYMATLPDADVFAHEIVSATPLHKVKDVKGKALTDKRLRSYASKHFPWIDDLYEESSRLIHFSHRHVFDSVRPDADKGEGHIVMSVRTDPSRWSAEVVDEFAAAFAHVTEQLLRVVSAWGDHKRALAARRGQAGQAAG